VCVGGAGLTVAVTRPAHVALPDPRDPHRGHNPSYAAPAPRNAIARSPSVPRSRAAPYLGIPLSKVLVSPLRGEGRPVSAFRSMFSQLLELIPRTEFQVLVKRTHAERHAREFTCGGHSWPWCSASLAAPTRRVRSAGSAEQRGQPHASGHHGLMSLGPRWPPTLARGRLSSARRGHDKSLGLRASGDTSRGPLPFGNPFLTSG